MIMNPYSGVEVCSLLASNHDKAGLESTRITSTSTSSSSAIENVNKDNSSLTKGDKRASSKPSKNIKNDKLLNRRSSLSANDLLERQTVPFIRRDRRSTINDSNDYDASFFTATPSPNTSSSATLRKNHTFTCLSSSTVKTRRSRNNVSNFNISRTHSSSSNATANSFNNNSSNNNNNNAYWNSTSVIQVAQRSNGSTVKSVITELQKIVEEATAAAAAATTDADSTTSSPSMAPPTQHCSVLAQWASVDVYYKVVITKYNGIPVLIDAMKTFPDCSDLQASCCSALSSLTNKVIIFQQDGGVKSILQALQLHSNNISVQSSALEALVGLMPLIDTVDGEEKEILVQEIRHLAMASKDMNLTLPGRTAANVILGFVEKL